MPQMPSPNATITSTPQKTDPASSEFPRDFTPAILDGNMKLVGTNINEAKENMDKPPTGVQLTIFEYAASMRVSSIEVVSRKSWRTFAESIQNMDSRLTLLNAAAISDFDEPFADSCWTNLTAFMAEMRICLSWR